MTYLNGGMLYMWVRHYKYWIILPVRVDITWRNPEWSCNNDSNRQRDVNTAVMPNNH